MFYSNNARGKGGALRIILHVIFKYCGHGNIYPEICNAGFDDGALPLNRAKSFDLECSADNDTMSFNNSMTFVRNTAEYRGGSISCESTSAITFIGTVYFNESYRSVIECSDSCNISFIGKM